MANRATGLDSVVLPHNLLMMLRRCARLIGFVFFFISIAPGLELRFARVGDEDISGNHQVVEAGRQTARPLKVQVLERGRPVAGVPVRFSVLSEPVANSVEPGGRATITDSVVLTDRTGFASTTVRLGSSAGDYRIKAAAGDAELVFSLRGLPRGWYVITAVEMVGGLALFLFGLYYGAKGLRRLAGGRLREAIFSFTRNRYLGLVVGVVVTAIFQSSGAVISLLVSLASSGLVTLGQSLGVILGADIGTTITVQLLSLRIFDYALLIVFVGFILMNWGRRLRDIGQAVFGFGLVFYSLQVVLMAAEPLQSVPQIQQLVADAARAPASAFIFALIFTALVRSSAATIGMLVGLSFAGLVELPAAVPFILGANVGSAVNGVLAAWRGTTEAKRIAAAQVIFKVVIALLGLVFLRPLTGLFFRTGATVTRQIANAHTLINLIAAILFLPFLGVYERLITALFPEGEDRKKGARYLDPGALAAPELALAQVTREILRMAEMVQEMFEEVIEVFRRGDKEGCRRLVVADDQVDRLDEEITGYLARLTQEELNPELFRRARTLFYITDELEHIADIISKNLVGYTRKKINENLSFSEEGISDIRQFHQEVRENLKLAIAVITTGERGLAEELTRRRNWGVARKQELHNRHLVRLSQGWKESLDTSTIHLDLIADLERVNFHLSQIGVAVIGTRFASASDASGPEQTDSGVQD